MTATQPQQAELANVWIAGEDASTDVRTRYEQPVEPDGTRERSPVA